MSPFSFGAALSPASSMLRSDGLRWKNKGIDERGEDIADFVFNAQNRAEDIALIPNMGFEVGDDNEPAPENVPADNAPPVINK